MTVLPGQVYDLVLAGPGFPIDSDVIEYRIPETVGEAKFDFYLASMTTSAVAGNRFLVLSLVNLNNLTLAEAPSSVAHVASTALTYAFGLVGAAYATSDRQVVPVPFDVVAPGDTLVLSSVGSQAGDVVNFARMRWRGRANIKNP